MPTVTVAYGGVVTEDTPEIILHCGCRLSGDSPRRGCPAGQQLFRQMEGLSMLIAMWPNLQSKDQHRDAEWRPHEPAVAAREAWYAHLEAGGIQ